MVELHRLPPSRFILVAIAIDTAEQAILRDLVSVVLAEMWVRIVGAVRPSGVICPALQRPKKWWINLRTRHDG